jgi:hypothetical protein
MMLLTMTKQLLVQTALTLIAAGLGSILGAFLARYTEQFKHLQELRSAAYTDFLRGVARAAEQGGVALVADSRARIAIYGGKAVLRSLSEFIALGAQTQNREGMQAFADLCGVMRAESGREQVPVRDISTVLFS